MFKIKVSVLRDGPDGARSSNYRPGTRRFRSLGQVRQRCLDEAGLAGWLDPVCRKMHVKRSGRLVIPVKLRNIRIITCLNMPKMAKFCEDSASVLQSLQSGMQ